MEELSGRGSRRPSKDADEREGKVAVEGGVQKRWLRQRSLERQIRETDEVFWEGRTDTEEKEKKNERSFSESFEGKSIG